MPSRKTSKLDSQEVWSKISLSFHLHFLQADLSVDLIRVLSYYFSSENRHIAQAEDMKHSNRDDVGVERNAPLVLAMVPLGIALNLGLGTIVTTLKLPLYVDAVGTILVTLLLGLRAGIMTGVFSFLLGGVLTNPVLPYFSGTQAAIAIYVYYMARRGTLQSTGRIVLTGIGLGILAGTVSAPVIAYLFGGITGSGPSLIVAYLLASGKSLIKSVLLSGLASEPLDKTIQCLISVWLIKGVPKSILSRFSNERLRKNRLL